MPDSLHLHLLSDSTGETLELIAKACLAQFDHVEMVQHLLFRERADLSEMHAQIIRRMDQGLSARTAAFHGKPPVSLLRL